MRRYEQIKILIPGLICLLLLGPFLSAEKKSGYYTWRELFSDPVERIYIIMGDHTIFPHTNHLENKIHLSIGWLKKVLKKEGYRIEDIAIVIHNHLKGCSFSDEDRKQLMRLKKYGFEGSFLLYCQRTGKVYNIEDEKKSTQTFT